MNSSMKTELTELGGLPKESRKINQNQHVVTLDSTNLQRTQSDQLINHNWKRLHVTKAKWRMTCVAESPLVFGINSDWRKKK